MYLIAVLWLQFLYDFKQYSNSLINLWFMSFTDISFKLYSNFIKTYKCFFAVLYLSKVPGAKSLPTNFSTWLLWSWNILRSIFWVTSLPQNIFLILIAVTFLFSSTNFWCILWILLEISSILYLSSYWASDEPPFNLPAETNHFFTSTFFWNTKFCALTIYSYS